MRRGVRARARARPPARLLKPDVRVRTGDPRRDRLGLREDLTRRLNAEVAEVDLGGVRDDRPVLSEIAIPRAGGGDELATMRGDRLERRTGPEPLLIVRSVRLANVEVTVSKRPA